jgi:hypothetical protein
LRWLVSNFAVSRTVKGKLGAEVGVSVGIGVGVDGGGGEVGGAGVEVGVRLGVSVGTSVEVGVGKGGGVSVGIEVGVGLGNGDGLGRITRLRVGSGVGAAKAIGWRSPSHRSRPEPKAVKATTPHKPKSREIVRAKINLACFLLNFIMSSRIIKVPQLYYTPSRRANQQN